MHGGQDTPIAPASVGIDNRGQPARGCKEMGTQNNKGKSYPTSDGFSTQQGINSCYSDPNCTHVFVNTSLYNPWHPNNEAHILVHRRQMKPVQEWESRLSVARCSPGIVVGQDECVFGHHISTYGHVENPAANLFPGATLIKTRFKDTTDGNKKYTGRAPNKPTFSGAFPVESKILISGDTAK